MGLFDTVVDAAAAIGREMGVNQSLVNGVAELLKGDGMRTILEGVKGGELEEVVKSWISKGANKPITAANIQKVLGSGKILEIAEMAGLSSEQTAVILKDLLPKLIDRFTPNGTIEQ